ncbi:dienelactone hydrolase family protein [bacterium]|nr:MAG: dienelactone hydrolase family protein [bacterium]
MRAIFAALLGLTTGMAMAEMKTEKVEYRDGDTVLEGYYAYDDAAYKGEKRPAILIVHDWNGLDGYEERRARELAALGYAAFAVDIYGKGVRPTNNAESGAQAGKYRADIDLFRSRLNAGLEALKARPGVDPARIGAIGYCFGGGGVLELLRSGAAVKAAVTFHGSLATPRPADAANIKAKILIQHASQDPSVPLTQLGDFIKEMGDAKVDYRMIMYNLAVHPFTVPGPQYNEVADKRSWAAMKEFFLENL